MITKSEAIKLVNERIERYQIETDSPIVINENLIIEENFGWVFFYNTLDFYQGGNSSCLAGNGPLIVEKKDGAIHETGSGCTADYFVKNFQIENNYPVLFKNASLYENKIPEPNLFERIIFRIKLFFNID